MIPLDLLYNRVMDFCFNVLLKMAHPLFGKPARVTVPVRKK